MLSGSQKTDSLCQWSLKGSQDRLLETVDTLLVWWIELWSGKIGSLLYELLSVSELTVIVTSIAK